MIPIWKETIPYYDPEKRQFSPSLTEFLLPGENLPCCIVIPGGGYAKKSWDQEGVVVAEWLNRIGISAFVLDYRIAPYDGTAIFADGQQAMVYVRRNAEKYGVDPHRIGVCGLSAGGHLAACISTMFETPEQRPDFSILCYPVMTLFISTHGGTARVFLGEKSDDPEAQKRCSPLYRITPDAPPAFLWTTETDRAVPPQENAVAAYEAYQKAGVESELIVFDHGEHGLGIPQNDPEIASWTDRCAVWLKTIHIIP